MSNRFLRSTNVAYDFSDPSSTKNIIITNPIQKLLNQLYLASSVQNASKAISIIGPYGTGKSTGLLFALKYFTGTLPLDQQKSLIHFDSYNNKIGNVKDAIVSPDKKYRTCILVGSRETINKSFYSSSSSY